MLRFFELTRRLAPEIAQAGVNPLFMWVEEELPGTYVEVRMAAPPPISQQTPLYPAYER